MTVSAVTSRSPSATSGPGRCAWMDNLRVAVIVGMLATHAATAYIVDIGWYYEERGAGAVAQGLAWSAVGVGALFGMGLLFLLAGLLAPRSLARKGPRRFARDRLLRLGVPLVVFVTVIDLLTDFFGYRLEGGDLSFGPFVGRWWRYDADLGPMWFVAMLLAFSLAYAGWRSRRPAPDRPSGTLDRRALLLAGGFIAAGSFVVRLEWPFLSDALFGLMAWELPQMVALFTVGVLAGERGWLADGLSDAQWRRAGRAGACGAVALLGAAGGIALSGDEEPFLGGPHVQALVLPVIEAVISIAMSLWALEWFRRRWDRGGALSAAMARASFAAYVIHPPVLVALSAVLIAVPVVVEVKFLVVWALGVAAAFGLGSLLARVPVLRRVL